MMRHYSETQMPDNEFDTKIFYLLDRDLISFPSIVVIVIPSGLQRHKTK